MHSIYYKSLVPDYQRFSFYISLCVSQFNLSSSKMEKKFTVVTRYGRIIFDSFEEFYNRADEILETFKVLLENPRFNWKEYKNYIYYQHRFCEDYSIDMQAKDKCFEWIMSYQYEYVSKNDLKSVLGQIRKVQK